MPAAKKKSNSSTTKKSTTTKASSKPSTKKVKNVKKNIKDVEKKMDTAMQSVANKISPSAKKKTQELLSKADEVAEKVDDLVDHVDEFADKFLPHGEGSSAVFQAEWSSKISRLFIFRFVWMIIQYFVIVVRGIWVGLLTVVHILYMLIFGKRERNLRNRQVRYFNHIAKWESYLIGLTDERPDMITPEKK